MSKKSKSQKIALCMLVCNEEEFLERCLKSAKGLYDELIVVDTGSKDKSVQVAKKFGAKVIEIEWRDDFAWARNEGIKKAKSEWIFILDPDEVIAKKDIQKIRELTKREGVMVCQIPTRNYTNNSVMPSFIPNRGEYEEELGYRGYVKSMKTRLFRNNIGLKFEGIIHEMIDYQAHRRKLNGVTTEIPIHHYTAEKARRVGMTKAFFMIRICEKKVEKNPKDGQAWWEMGAIQSSMGLQGSALESMKIAIKLGHVKPEFLFIVAMLLKNMKKIEEGNRYFEKAICLINPELTHIKEEFKKLRL